MAGGIYVPPMDLGYDSAEAADLPNGNAHAPTGMGAVRYNAIEEGFQTQLPLGALRLTPRQNEVLGLLLLGKPNKLIARDLGLSVETVKDHVAAVLRCLNVSSRTQAVLAVAQMSRQPGGLGGRRSNGG